MSKSISLNQVRETIRGLGNDVYSVARLSDTSFLVLHGFEALWHADNGDYIMAVSTYELGFSGYGDGVFVDNIYAHISTCNRVFKDGDYSDVLLDLITYMKKQVLMRDASLLIDVYDSVKESTQSNNHGMIQHHLRNAAQLVNECGCGDSDCIDLSDMINYVLGCSKNLSE